MVIDLAALKTALETNSRYDVAVTSGKNRDLLRLLNADEPNQTVFQAVSSEDVLDAIGDGIRSLTAMQLETLRIFTNREEVDFRKPSIRTELRQIFAGNDIVLTRITTAITKTRSYGEAFGGTVTLQNLWAVLKNIPKSYMATKLADR